MDVKNVNHLCMKQYFYILSSLRLGDPLVSSLSVTLTTKGKGEVPMLN